MALDPSPTVTIPTRSASEGLPAGTLAGGAGWCWPCATRVSRAREPVPSPGSPSLVLVDGPGELHHVDDLGGEVLVGPVEGGHRGLAELGREVDGLGDERRGAVLLELERGVVDPVDRRLHLRGELSGEVEGVLDDQV